MKLFKIFSLSIVISLISTSLFSQNNVGIGTTTPDASAILELQASDKGMLVPRLTTVERIAIANPAEALLVYDIDIECFFYFKQSTGWENLCSGIQGPAGPAGTNGIDGIDGIDGATGPQGPSGINGATGPQGPAGPAGPVGINGTNGIDGIDGIDGINGTDGISIIDSEIINDSLIITLSNNQSINAGSVISTTNSVSTFQTFVTYPNDGSYTFTVPANCTKIMIEVWGAGGGGGNNSLVTQGYTSGGGGGGYGKQIFPVVPGTIYNLVVGAGGTAGSGNGAASSFGSLISASGGIGGMSIGNYIPVSSGGTSVADFNVQGETGNWTLTTVGGHGGGSFGSHGGRGATNGVVSETGMSPGGGGGAGIFQFPGYTNGAPGAAGRIVVWY